MDGVLTEARAARGPISERLVESIYVALAAWLLAGAYVAAWDAIRPAGTASHLGPWSEGLAVASWVALTGFLLAVGYANHLRGQPVARLLPFGYEVALGACILFAMGIVTEPYWLAAFPAPDRGLETLVSPPRILDLAAAGVIAAAPLRSALSRREPVATLSILLSAGLVLSVATFGTQFADPLVDPWAGRGTGEPVVSPWWVAQDLGTISLIFQALLAGFLALVLLRSFRLRFGSLTMVFAVNGVLVCILKSRFAYLPAMVLTGLVADLLIASLQPGRERPLRLRLFAALLPAAYSAFTMATVILNGGTWWSPTLVGGAVVLPALLGWLSSYLALSYEGRSGAAARLPRGKSVVDAEELKKALDALHEGDRAAFAGSPLTALPCLTGPPEEAGEELRSMLVELIKELASSRSPRDAESGQILLEYFVHRVGSHEVVLGPMHMSKQTYFRRLERGKALVRERLDELSEYAVSASP